MMLLALLTRTHGGSGKLLRKSCQVYQQRMCSTNKCIFPNAEAVAGTMSEVKKESNRMFGIRKTYSVLRQSRAYLQRHEPKSVDELPTRSMFDSFTSALIPLATDTELRDRYVTVLGTVRLGRLMEDMDHFAVWVLQKHVHLPKIDPTVPLPYNFVTVLVDKISFTSIVARNDDDIRLSGHVSWVGRSTAEVSVWLEQKHFNQWYQICSAIFLMASRNAVNTRAALINPLQPANEKEQKIFNDGESRKKRRLQLLKESAFNREPNEDEQKVIHTLFSTTNDLDNTSFKSGQLPPFAVWMDQAIMYNHLFPHPEDRNAHNTVFGGFLMRHALELSWALCYEYSKHRPQLKHISDISFKRPVPVASIIKMSAHIIYTEMNYMQIVVVSEAKDLASGHQSITNYFYYTYTAPERVLQIIPRTYHEAIWYLEGRRKFLAALELDGCPTSVM